MDEFLAYRRRPFIAAAAAVAFVCLIVLALPASFLAFIGRNSPFSSSQAGWAYRLLAFFAVAQALYGGFVALQASNIKKSRAKDPKGGMLTRGEIMRWAVNTGSFMALLTLIYGAASLAVSGQRGGFWLFPLIALAQGAWYYRLTGDIARWLLYEPEPPGEEAPADPWEREPPDYCPPLARGSLRETSGGPERN